MTLTDLALIEDQRGHADVALHRERDALRYTYLTGDIFGIPTSYHNLSNYFRRPPQLNLSLAAHLTAALICAFTGIGADSTQNAATAVHAAADDIRKFGTAAEPPADIADLCDRLADIEGTDLPGLINKLSPDPQTAERTLQDLVARARVLAERPLEVRDEE